jgi:hypothetical protein
MTTLASDDFNRANNPNLGSNWSVLGTSAANRFDIQSNGISAIDTVSFHSDRYSAITWPDNQWSEAKIITFPTQGGGPMVRGITTGSAKTLYLGQAGTAGSVIAKWLNNVRTEVAVSFTNTFSINDIARIEVEGTALRMYKNGSLVLSGTDSSITSGQPGIFIELHNSTSAVLYDDWAGGNFTASTSKAVVGGAYTIMGTTSGGQLASVVTFDVHIAQIDASYWTQIEVTILESDSQAGIRSKMVSAVKTQALAVFGLTLNDADVILSNYYIGLNP